MSAGFTDLVVSFPDPVTGRGIVVNALQMVVLNALGAQVASYNLDSGIERVDSLLLGAVYRYRDFVTSNPTVTPEGYVTLSYTATVGDQVLGVYTQTVSFRPTIADTSDGVLITWIPPEIIEPQQIQNDVVFYEVRRVDERKIVAGITTAQYAQGPYGLSYWPFDADFDDDILPSSDFMNMGGVELYPIDATKHFARFHGYDYLETVASTKLSFAARQDFSISAQVRINPYMGARGCVIGKMGGAIPLGYGILIDHVGNSFYPSLYVGGGYPIYLTSTVDIHDGNFHHVVLTVDRDGMATLWVDAVQTVSADVSAFADMAFTAWDVRVGANNMPAPDMFWGDIDELVVFNGVLTDLDVEKLHEDQNGIDPEEIVGRTDMYQMLDTQFSDPYTMRHYIWRVYKAVRGKDNAEGEDYAMTLYKTMKSKDVQFTGAPMCFVEGKTKLPNDVFPSDSKAYFYENHRDRGMIVHDRIMTDEVVTAYVNPFGKFGAYLIQDAVVVCHIPDAHVKWRFAVPRSALAKLSEIPVQVLKFTNNL